MMGQGQFCTSPGVWAVIAKSDTDSLYTNFVQSASSAITETEAGVMLTPKMAKGYQTTVNEWQSIEGVELLAQGQSTQSEHLCRAALFATDLATFEKNSALHEEVFGSSALIIRCADFAEMMTLISVLKGNLTASIHALDSDVEDARRVALNIAHKVGRLIYNQMPTGVEVCASMNHGGPFPASTQIRTTSVGSEAIKRFQRPICYQNMPQALLPTLLQN